MEKLREGYTFILNNFVIATDLSETEYGKLLERYQDESTFVRKTSEDDVVIDGEVRGFRLSKSKLLEKFESVLRDAKREGSNFALIDVYGTVGGRFFGTGGDYAVVAEYNFSSFDLLENGVNSPDLVSIVNRMSYVFEFYFSNKIEHPKMSAREITVLKQFHSESLALGWTLEPDGKEKIMLMVFDLDINSVVRHSLATTGKVYFPNENKLVNFLEMEK